MKKEHFKGVRVDDKEVEILSALREKMQKDEPRRNVTESDVFRECLHIGAKEYGVPA